MSSGGQHGISIWAALLPTLLGAYFAFGRVPGSTRESKVKLYVRRIAGWVFFLLGLVFLLGLAMAHTTFLQ